MSYLVYIEIGIPAYCMIPKKLFYPYQKTSEFENYIEEFYQGLKAKFKVLPYENTKYVAYKDPTNVTGIYFEDEVFVANFD